MSLAKGARSQIRKAKQAEPPHIKFRSSCDLCTEAKVRCDKKAQCSRCTRLGSMCRYSVSMRTGKPAIDLLKSLNAGATLLPPQQQQTSSHPHPSLDSASELPDAEQCFQDFLRISPSHTADTISVATELSSLASTPFEGFSQRQMMDFGFDCEPLTISPPLSNPSASPTNNAPLQPDQPRTSMDTCSPSNAALVEYNEQGPDDNGFHMYRVRSPLLSYITPPETSSPNHAPHMQSACSNHSSSNAISDKLVDPALRKPQQFLPYHDCVQKTQVLQQSLAKLVSEDATSYSSETNVSHRTTTDQALLLCVTAINQLTDILSCQCNTNAYHPFLISVVISKVLAVYGAIAKVDDSTPFCLFGPSNAQDDHGQHQASFVEAPLRLGTYNIDTGLEGLLRAQLVSHELYKFKPVVELFCDKYGSPSSAEIESMEEKSIYSALCDFITRRYDKILGACERKVSSTTQKAAN